MTNHKTDCVLNIELDASELLILNGGSKSDGISSDELISGFQAGTKVGKPPPPSAPTKSAV